MKGEVEGGKGDMVEDEGGGDVGVVDLGLGDKLVCYMWMRG